MAFVWPDQRARLDRLEAAIGLSRRNPPIVERAEASAWLAGNVQPRTGAATVLMHSVVFSYLPPEAQARVSAYMETAAKNANAEAPLGWLSFELNPANEVDLDLTLWPGGERRRLARAHPHASWIAPE